MSHKYCRVILNDIIGNLNCSFRNIIFQKETPSDHFFTLYEVFEGL